MFTIIVVGPENDGHVPPACNSPRNWTVRVRIVPALPRPESDPPGYGYGVLKRLRHDISCVKTKKV